MLKKLICILVFFLISLDVYSMDIDLGGKLGLGVGWWRGDTYEKDVDILGAPIATFGPYASVEVHKYVALQFELMFAFIGNKDEKEYSNIKSERNFRNYAFEAPIYLKPKFKLGPGDMFFLFGPKFLVLLDDFDVTIRTSASNISLESESTFDIGRQFHLGLALGLGYDLKLGPGKLQFAINITPYLTNFGKSCDKASYNEFYFDVGYAYTFKN